MSLNRGRSQNTDVWHYMKLVSSGEEKSRMLQNMVDEKDKKWVCDPMKFPSREGRLLAAIPIPKVINTWEFLSVLRRMNSAIFSSCYI